MDGLHDALVGDWYAGGRRTPLPLCFWRRLRQQQQQWEKPASQRRLDSHWVAVVTVVVTVDVSVPFVASVRTCVTRVMGVQAPGLLSGCSGGRSWHPW